MPAARSAKPDLPDRAGDGAPVAAARNGRPDTEASQKAKAIRGSQPTGLAFYAEVLKFLKKTKIPFMVGGTYAIQSYTGIDRPTKDVDIFCRAGDYPRILNAAAEAKYKTKIEDDRWIAKIGKGRFYCDVIFGSSNLVMPVTDEWFREAHGARVLDVEVRLLPPTELIWSKVFVMDRYKYDGNDVAHLFLRMNERIDWRKLLAYMEQHWEVLLLHLIKFRFVYPSERERIPRWLIDELLSRLTHQMRLPTPQAKTCRGRMFSWFDYMIDIEQWGFADMLGQDRSA